MPADKLYPGHCVAVEQEPNGDWSAGERSPYGGISASSATISLCIGQLGRHTGEQPDLRAQALQELHDLGAKHSYPLMRLIDELDQILKEFYGPSPTGVSVGEEEMQMSMRQASLCRTWLDFLTGASDYQAGRTVSPTEVLLWRRYYRALAVLYEQDWQGWCNFEAHYRRALRNWSRILTDPANEWFVARLIAEEHGGFEKIQVGSFGRVWEEEIKDLVWRPDGGFRRFFQKPGDGHIFLDRLMRQSILPHYDFASVGRIVEQLMIVAKLPSRTRRLYAVLAQKAWLVAVVLALAVVGGVVGAVITTGFTHQLSLALTVAGLVTTAATLCVVVWTVVQIGRSALYPFSLRLTAGTFVGLLAILGLNDQVAEFTFTAFCPGQALPQRIADGLLLVCSLGGALLYTISDVLNRVNDKKLAWRRALQLFVFGLAQAIVFAAVASWLLGGRLAPPSAAIDGCLALNSLQLGIGAIYVDFIVSAGILSLTIGVLTQILWQERAISEPL